ncbi:hypothetical protein Pd630_LPD13070 (plasmid) [Rhodococcus opacus PD630]|nr:hypothetical protein Pd630_LPD13070 [Rhodococcus opacus PD630]
MHQVIELELPKPGPNQVRVRIVTSGINPTDSKTRAWHAGRTPNRFQVQHHDGSGVVDAVGSDVVGVPVWQRVWLHVAAFGNHYGTAAEYALFPAARAAPLPDVCRTTSRPAWVSPPSPPLTPSAGSRRL